MTWADSDEPGDVAAAGDELSSMVYEQEFAAIAVRGQERLRDPAKRPPGARHIRFFASVVPAAPLSSADGS